MGRLPAAGQDLVESDGAGRDAEHVGCGVAPDEHELLRLHAAQRRLREGLSIFSRCSRPA